MPNIYLLIDLFVVTTLAILGIVVFIKNKYVALNRLFVLFTVCIGVWIMANYISNDLHNPPEVATVANYFVFGFSYAAAFFLLRFVTLLTPSKVAESRLRKFYIPIAVIGLLSFTPLVVAGVELQGNLYAVKFGLVAYLYFLALLTFLVATIRILGKGIKHATGDHKARLKVLYRSTFASLSLVMIAQSVLPVATGWFGLTNIGILPMLILVSGLYYAAAKHKLFDLRFVIVRSAGYVFAIALIGVVYGIVTFFIINKLAGDSRTITRTQEFIFISTAVFMAFTFQSIKSFFDKVTRKIFYQDSYEPQLLLDELNRQLVSTIDVEILLLECSKTITKYLRSQFTQFSLNKTAYAPQRFIGATDEGITQDNIGVIRARIPELKMLVTMTDELGEGTNLKNVLQKNNIALTARITYNPESTENDGLGYLFLGAKRSGNTYTKQDIKIIEIIVNELVIAIENTLRFEEIEKFNATLQQKVDDATKQLRETNERLKQLDEAKDEFISMASHQLRTPLTSVKGYLSMVLEGDAGEIQPMQRKLLDQAFTSSQRMVYLIADLLNVSRLRTGKFVIEPIMSNLADVVEGEIGQLKETAEGRGLALTYDKPETFPALYIDETKIRQVIMNFIDNAIYYTPKGGHIDVKLVDKGQSVELTVNDNGMGVPKSEQQHLFTKFYRAENAQKARPDGTGLGLFMAKKVIVAQGGNLIFTSQEGKGSTFGFSLPKAKLLPPVTSENVPESSIN